MTVSRLQPYATTVFAEMSALAARVGAVNLGQGFPDEDGPPAMLKAAQDAIAEGVNQYPPGIGVAALREAVAAQRKRHFGIDYDPETEVLVTVGATEAIAAAVIGLVEPGSEVILIQPFYDSYSPVVAMAGAAAGHRAAGARRSRLCPRHRRAAACGDTAHQGVDRQLTAQPHRDGAQRGRADGHRAGRGGRRLAGHHRRGLRASGVSTAAGTYRWPVSTGWPSAPSRSRARRRCSTAPAGRSDGLAGQPNSSSACGRPSSI